MVPVTSIKAPPSDLGCCQFYCCWFMALFVCGWVFVCVCVWGGGGQHLVLVLLCSILCPFKFCKYLDGEERAGLFTYIVLLMYYECKFSVDLLLGTKGWYAVWDCGSSYLLTFYEQQWLATHYISSSG